MMYITPSGGELVASITGSQVSYTCTIDDRGSHRSDTCLFIYLIISKRGWVEIGIYAL
jgi:hypothetical protein